MRGGVRGGIGRLDGSEAYPPILKLRSPTHTVLETEGATDLISWPAGRPHSLLPLCVLKHSPHSLDTLDIYIHSWHLASVAWQQRALRNALPNHSDHKERAYKIRAIPGNCSRSNTPVPIVSAQSTVLRQECLY